MMSFENSRTSVTNNFATMQTFHLGDLQISNTSNYKDKTINFIHPGPVEAIFLGYIS